MCDRQTKTLLDRNWRLTFAKLLDSTLRPSNRIRVLLENMQASVSFVLTMSQEVKNTAISV